MTATTNVNVVEILATGSTERGTADTTNTTTENMRIETLATETLGIETQETETHGRGTQGRETRGISEILEISIAIGNVIIEIRGKGTCVMVVIHVPCGIEIIGMILAMVLAICVIGSIGSLTHREDRTIDGRTMEDLEDVLICALITVDLLAWSVEHHRERFLRR
jgi:hypothetical protein